MEVEFPHKPSDEKVQQLHSLSYKELSQNHAQRILAEGMKVNGIVRGLGVHALVQELWGNAAIHFGMECVLLSNSESRRLQTSKKLHHPQFHQHHQAQSTGVEPQEGPQIRPLYHQQAHSTEMESNLRLPQHQPPPPVSDGYIG
ncbi:hypothetical protein M0R45_038230 [Rubus argutus]|uniref:Uncharacterized protein n=1 Tax=Rubus argutus TaxID=59490 RepID=A0AAW1W2Y4_RUBAR